MVAEMTNLRKAIVSGRRIILWGTGSSFEKYADSLSKYISIDCVCDSDVQKHNKIIKGFICIAPSDIECNDFVIIMARDKNIVKEIKEHLIKRKIEFCTLDLALMTCKILEEENIVRDNLKQLSNDDTKWDNVMRKYIGIHVPVAICNLSCPYCYVRQSKGFSDNPIIDHSPEYIRLQLSQQRLGGQALIVLCGAGETLLGDKIIEICAELLKEGHFIHIVTNGTLTDRIKELVKAAGKYAGHLFFKFSFHYEELVKRGMLDIFAQNVNYVSGTDASFTVELTADDKLIPFLKEIKEYSLQNFGALPHITIARDESSPDYKILTSLSYNEYYNIWSTFDSKLFEIKWDYYGKHIYGCMAGEYSLFIDLLSGNIMKCLHQPVIDNLYNWNENLLSYSPVGNDCNLPYCYNNHAYLTMGVVPGINAVSYAEVRDRTTEQGDHWLKPEVFQFINQKIYDNNI